MEVISGSWRDDEKGDRRRGRGRLAISLITQRLMYNATSQLVFLSPATFNAMALWGLVRPAGEERRTDEFGNERHLCVQLVFSVPSMACICT